MHKIKKAIIPVAGLATRVFPMNKVTKKAFLPIIDKDNRVKPVILKLLEELQEAEIEEFYLIIGENDEELYNKLFNKVEDKVYEKISNEDKEYENKIVEIGKKVKYIVQHEQLGFGHAVYLAKEYVNDEPALLILGDTIYKSNIQKNCAEQILEFYDKNENVIIAVQEIEEHDLKNYGTVKGNWDNTEKTEMSLETIVEKPSIEYANKNLRIDEKFYGNFGEFVLTKEVFDELEKIINNPISENEEYQLMDAFENIIKTGNAKGLVINGRSYDAGNIESYIKILRKY